MLTLSSKTAIYFFWAMLVKIHFAQIAGNVTTWTQRTMGLVTDARTNELNTLFFPSSHTPEKI